MSAFLEREGAWPVMEKLRRTQPDAKRFTLAVHQWFDSLRIVRYLNAGARARGKTWLYDAWSRLLQAGGEAGLLRSLPPLPRPQPSLESLRAWKKYWAQPRALRLFLA